MRCTVCGGWYCYRCGKPLSLDNWLKGPQWRTHGAVTYGCRCVLTSGSGRTNGDFPDPLGDAFDYPGHWMIDGWL